MNLPQYTAAMTEAIADFEGRVDEARTALRKCVDQIRSEFFEDQTQPMPADCSYEDKVAIR